jgi:hypothetical protein
MITLLTMISFLIVSNILAVREIENLKQKLVGKIYSELPK